MRHGPPLKVLVESANSFKKLKSLNANGCDTYQEFIFAAAISVPEFIKKVNSLGYKKFIVDVNGVRSTSQSH
jgi:EAL domain-containing protein (putative c-di-GMP-specific phosphodiesterase class I)